MPLTRSCARLFACILCLLFLSGPAAAEEVPMDFSANVIEVAVGIELDMRTLLVGIVRADFITFFSTNPSVASVTDAGLVKVLSPGRTRITAKRENGDRADITLLCVQPKPQRRALLLCEQRYDDGRERIGAMNTVQGVSDTLSLLRYRKGAPFSISIFIDSSATRIQHAIQRVLGSADPDDVSLFYISCHGEIVDGEPTLLLHDGTSLTVRRLEEMLRVVQGRVVVLLDCCQSGAFIGESASELFAQSAANTFVNSPMLNGKYLVLASCGADEDSYRMSDTGEVTEVNMSTVFGRTLCEGLGWDLDNDRSVTLRADANRDGIVSFTELWQYTRRRVFYHLSGTGVTQTVMAYPEMEESALFARQWTQ